MLPLLLALLLGAPPPAASLPAPVRLAAMAFGKPVQIEVRDLPAEAAREVIQKALAEVAEIERLTSGGGPDGGLTALNAAAGKGPQPVDPRLLSLLAVARDFCFWSEGAHGPMGRDLYSLWGLRTPVPDPPAPERLETAVSVAACDRLTLDPVKGTAALAEGSGVELWGFAEGYAVDRAAEVLRQGGAANSLILLGSVQRGAGGGPDGKGWPVLLPQVPGQEDLTGRIYLRDQSLSVAAQSDHPLQGGNAPYVNQRTGRPAQGVLVIAAVTELAVDAQGLAAALIIAGPREGQLRLGSLRPRPSVLWFMGSGTGAPLLVDYRWSAVNRR
ncbi:MAG TPA: FAD:protein FMN transferase [Thermoanaerobaculia bacterium]|nr:FAD:protein FMN transferase [Thermoanaerobaculia bacterium]